MIVGTPGQRAIGWAKSATTAAVHRTATAVRAVSHTTGITRFVDWYGKQKVTRLYRTNLGTAATGMIGGDWIARVISGNPIDLATTGVFLAMATYYAWEGDAQYRAIHHAFPMPEADPDLQAALSAEGKRFLFGERLKMGVLRSLAKECAFSPMSTTRHIALMAGAAALVNPAQVSAVDTPEALITKGLEVYVGSIAVYLPIDFLIQTFLPLRYRFLAKTVLNMGWQVFASLKLLS